MDGKRIYEAPSIGMRIVPTGTAPEPTTKRADQEEPLDPKALSWLGDHQPTFTVPALPMMSMVDRLLAAAERLARAGAISANLMLGLFTLREPAASGGVSGVDGARMAERIAKSRRAGLKSILP